MAVEVINTRYEILETTPSVETGPFVVHKARDMKEGRVVCLKVIPAQSADLDSSFVANFRSAARAAGTLDHPMIARTYEVGALANGDLYLVTDYLRGISLRERIRRIAPFSLAVATDIAAGVAEALVAAHRAGIVHGRLIPEEVTLSPEGQIRVEGFGISRVVEEHLAPHFAVAATRYRIPGSTAGGTPTKNDDIYALGAILYEMLTGAPPVAAVGAPLVAPRAFNPGIPPALDGITLKALSTSPSVRYQNAEALLEDLHAARTALRAGKSLAWSPLSASGPSVPAHEEPAQEEENVEEDERPSRRGRQREAPSALSVAVRVLFVVALIGIVALTWFFTRFLAVPSDIAAPNLVGATLDDARALGHQKNFIPVVKKRDFSTKWPEGQIYAQEPVAGRTIKAGGEIDVYVSQGPRFLTVPDLVGMTSDRAQKALREATLKAGQITEAYSDKVQKGVVISQKPNPATNVARDATVSYVVSKGQEPPAMPTNVEARAVGPDSIEITWYAAERADSYRITRIAAGDAVDVAKELKGTRFTDTGLQPDMAYEYVIVAVNEAGESDPSDRALETTASASSSPDDSMTVTPQDVDVAVPDLTAAPMPAPTPSADAARQRQFRISFRLPRRPRGEHRVRFEIQDDTGTTLVYDEMHRAGDRIDTRVPAFGSKVIFRVFVDDTLMKQQAL